MDEGRIKRMKNVWIRTTKKTADDDHDLQGIAKSIYEVFQSLIDAGFTAEQALELTGVMIRANN